MILDLAALLMLAEQCAPQVAPDTLLAVVRAESAGDPLALATNGAHAKAYHPQSPAAAAGLARALVARGESVDLGLGQVNSANLASLSLGVAEAFDPCRNLAASARVLTAAWRGSTGPDPQARLGAALSRYNTGDPARGLRNGYVARVRRAARQIVPSLRGEAGPAAATDPTSGAEGAPTETRQPLDIFARPDAARVF